MQTIQTGATVKDEAGRDAIIISKRGARLVVRYASGEVVGYRALPRSGAGVRVEYRKIAQRVK